MGANAPHDSTGHHRASNLGPWSGRRRSASNRNPSRRFITQKCFNRCSRHRVPCNPGTSQSRCQGSQSPPGPWRACRPWCQLLGLTRLPSHSSSSSSSSSSRSGPWSRNTDPFRPCRRRSCRQSTGPCRLSSVPCLSRSKSSSMEAARPLPRWPPRPRHLHPLRRRLAPRSARQATS